MKLDDDIRWLIALISDTGMRLAEAAGPLAAATATAAAASHDHETPLDLPAGPGAPSLSVEATPDPSSGWNLHLETGNFAFSPEHASTDHVPGEGHAHVYIDGVKLGRFYGPWLHLPAQEPGTEVRVTLNANDHRLLAVGGDRVEETLMLD